MRTPAEWYSWARRVLQSARPYSAAPPTSRNPARRWRGEVFMQVTGGAAIVPIASFGAGPPGGGGGNTTTGVTNADPNQVVVER